MSVKLKDNIIWSAIDDEVMLLDTTTGEFYSLNDTAAAIWQGLERGDTVDGIAAALAATYAVEPAVARRDVEELIAELRGMGVLD